MTLTRRQSLGMLALAAPSLARAQNAARIVVIGGGFGGAAAARALVGKGFHVTLVEKDKTFTACPFSNAVLVGLRQVEQQQFGYAALARQGIGLVHDTASRVDTENRQVVLASGQSLPYDRLVLSPGIDLNYAALPGYSPEVAETLPHAWKAGDQTRLLARQLAALVDGETVLMTVPANPYRCPPGPYERASLIAWYLKTKKPRSKLIVLDAKDAFSKQRLFQQAWAQLYPDHLEWIGLAKGGNVTRIDAGERVVVTDFGRTKGAVINVIPPQKAAAIAELAGVADRSGWCPVDPVTFESRLRPGVHVLGDAAIMGAMPKSAFAAHAQAKSCAEAVSALLKGQAPPPVKLINTCYSLVAPDYGISVAGVYEPQRGLLADVAGAGGTSPPDAPLSRRKAEADLAEGWFTTITGDVYG